MDTPWRVVGPAAFIAGQTDQVAIHLGIPALPLLGPGEVGIESITYTQPLPPGIVLGGSSFSPSVNIDSDAVLSGSDLIITLTPKPGEIVTAADIQLPVATLTFGVTALPGSTVMWAPFSHLTEGLRIDLLGGPVTNNCTPVPGQIVRTTPVIALGDPVPTTTVPTTEPPVPTTGVPTTPPTTARATTTTRPVSTTTRPVTTTKPPTTTRPPTTKPPTTKPPTTKPPTTRPGGGGLGGIVRWILCHLFHIC